MLEELKKRLREHEGFIPHMYLDTLGYVTAAVGHLLSTARAAAALPFMRPDGTPATPDEIEQEFDVVKALEPSKLPSYYAARTKLRLASEAIAGILDQDVAAMSKALVALLPSFAQFPEMAQEALLDMAFQLGPAGLVDKFPHLIGAVKARDWNACAQQCHRAGIQEWRNKATADLFRRSGEEVTNSATA